MTIRELYTSIHKSLEDGTLTNESLDTEVVISTLEPGKVGEWPIRERPIKLSRLHIGRSGPFKLALQSWDEPDLPVYTSKEPKRRRKPKPKIKPPVTGEDRTVHIRWASEFVP
jgi:hypothetical protein